VGIFNFWRKTIHFFSPEEREKIVEAIRHAEMQTSGEIRVFVESHCRFVDPIDRAVELFGGLHMEKTSDRNGVLVYVAMKDRQLAIFGDEGIHRKVGDKFWTAEVQKMINQFNSANYAEGIAEIIKEIGDALRYHFPYDKLNDKNELPDDIVFGK
jgi:uncharacterized membrane protein